MQHEFDLLQLQANSLLHHIDKEEDLFIISMKSLAYLKVNEKYDQMLQPLHATAQWALDFLCKSHVDLGRKGAVCPFTKPSIEKELFWLSLYLKPNSHPADISQLMIKYRDIFLQLPPQNPREAQYKTILIVFPHFNEQDCTELIDRVQLQLKPDFVSKGLMIGQFHANCQESGLWNSAFRPLQSPFPMLVIRNLVISDYPFLEHEQNLVNAWKSHFPLAYKNYLNKVKAII